MKPFRKLYILALALPALMLTGCSDDNEPWSDTDTPDELTLTLSVPDPEEVTLDSRAADPAVTSVTVFCYKNTGTSGGFLERSTVKSGITGSGNSIRVTVPIHKLTKSVHIVTNIDETVTGEDPAAIVTSSASKGVMWGRANLSDIISSGSTVSMLRQAAKVTVATGGTIADFALEGFGVARTAATGSIAPAGWNLTPTAPSVSHNPAYTADSSVQPTSADVYVFETPKSQKPRIIVRGSYKGKSGYYCIAFAKRSGSGESNVEGNYTYTDLDVLRNHWYKVSITGVRAAGWDTYAEALASEPDNRLTVTITDVYSDITDIIADRDYMLGVSDTVRVEYNQAAAISVLTNYKVSSGRPYRLSSTSAWIKTAQATVTAETQAGNMTSGTNKTGTLYQISVPLEPNSNKTTENIGKITVTAGDLTRDIVVIQGGRDYKRDPNRKVQMLGLPGNSNVADYFDFLDNTLQGAKPEDDLRGVIRNEGLHFPVVPAYTVTYRIPRLTGDNSPATSSGFTVSTTATYYEVKLSSTAAGIAEGTFTLKNGNGATIVYPLYKTGVIHHLTGAHAAYQREEVEGAGPVSGWFYYGVVSKNCYDRKNRKNVTYYILDRNLGASCNFPYISTWSNYKDNRRAIGGYFKIAETKTTATDSLRPKTILANLGITHFDIPRENELEAWEIRAQKASGTSSALSQVACFTATNPSIDVYIPHGGYYEATSPKCETHANLWTRSLLAGNQGFDPVMSAEYGYWYRYLDVYGSKVGLTQIRFATGSGGIAPTESSVYRYMPLRLMWYQGIN